MLNNLEGEMVELERLNLESMIGVEQLGEEGMTSLNFRDGHSVTEMNEA